MSDIVLEEVVALALRLTVPEQARLLERVAANLAHEVESPLQGAPADTAWTDAELVDLLKPAQPRSGAEIAAMIESGELDTRDWSEMANPHITDAVEWLKALRREMSKTRNPDWGI